MDLLKQVCSVKGHEADRETGACDMQGEAEGAGTGQPGEEESQEDLFDVYKCLMGGCREDGARLFLVVPPDSTRGNEHKLKHEKANLNMRKTLFCVGVIRFWNKESSRLWGLQTD